MGQMRYARLARWAAMAAIMLAGLYAGDNPDTFGHLAQGRQIAELGRVPLRDTWSLLAPPRLWHNYEWLSDLLVYALYRGFGYDGLIGAKCLLLGLTVWLLLRLSQRWGGARAEVLAALVVIAGIPAIRFRLTDRPHVFGLCLAAAYLLCLSELAEARGSAREQDAEARGSAREQDAEAEGRATQSARRRLLALLFGLHVLWVNLHGSHLLGLGVTGLFLLFARPPRARSLCAALALQLLASCISPYGPAIVLDAFDHVFDRRYSAIISEWNAWSEQDPPWLQLGPALQAALLTLCAPRLVRAGGTLRAGLVVAAVLALGCFRSIRFVADFVLLSSPLLGVGLAQLTTGLSERRFVQGTAFAALASAVLVPWGASQLPPYRGLGHGTLDTHLPRGVGALLQRAGRPPRVFATMQVAWPLMWEAPKARFFIDGRVPFYGPEHVAMSRAAFADTALFTAILARDEIDAVVLHHAWQEEEKPLTELQRRSDWQVVEIDDRLVLFVRADLARTSGFEPFRVLRPSLASDWVLELPSHDDPRLDQELGRVAATPGAQGYASWVRGLRALAPLQRGRVQDGFRWPTGAAETARYRNAARHLRQAVAALPGVPAMLSLLAVVEATLCNLDAAEAALARALKEVEPNRQTMLAAQEIALRRGQEQQVGQLVRAALSRPEARGDLWLAELARGIEQPPSCAAPGAEAK
jgi:hypothetical protein